MYDKDFQASTRHPVLIKHTKLLEKLNDEHVMCVCYHRDDKSFYLLECCDDWYNIEINKSDCLELSQMFKEIAESMGDSV